MVKFTSFVIAIAAAAVASAAPYRSERYSVFSRNECIPEIDIKEYESFILKSSNLNTYLSAARGMPLVAAGVSPQPDHQTLTMCVVSSPGPCNPPFETHCLFDNVDYRFRIERPFPGYFRVVGSGEHKIVEIVQDFYDASPLNFYKESGWGLRIAERQEDGSRMVFETRERGEPITLNKPVKDSSRQWFTITPANGNRVTNDLE